MPLYNVGGDAIGDAETSDNLRVAPATVDRMKHPRSRRFGPASGVTTELLAPRRDRCENGLHTSVEQVTFSCTIPASMVAITRP